MKKLTDVFNKPFDYESDGVFESLDDFDNIAQQFLDAPLVGNPKCVVSDNPKMRKLAELVVSLIDKKCGWKAYYHTFIMNIDGMDTVLILNADGDNAVTVTPSGTTGVVRYYLNYDLKSDSHQANFTITTRNMGLVRMYDLLFDIINNTEAYAGGLYECDGNSDLEGRIINEGVDLNDNELFKVWNNIENFGKYKPIKNWVEGRTGKPQLGDTITLEGIDAIAEYLKNVSFTPFGVVKSLYYDTDFNDNRLREMLANVGNDNKDKRIKRASAETYAAIVHIICTSSKYGINANVKVNENVDIANNVVTSPDMNEYRGVDITLINSIYPGRFNDFKKLVDKYFKQMDDMKKRTQYLVEYCRKTKTEKLKSLDEGSTAIFISGVGGIGKSETWETIKNEMNLVKGKDYAERDNSTCNAKELYNFLYNNNGKVLVFDDTPNLFDTSFQQSFWKKALEPKGGRFPSVKGPSGSDMGDAIKGNFYSKESCKVGEMYNYKEMYYKECPETRNRAIRRQNRAIKGSNQKQTAERLIPDTMDIMSRFIIITNMSEDKLEKSVGDSWGAIQSRCKFYRIAPPVLVIWAKVKDKLLQVKNSNDRSWSVPPEYVDAVIELVETELKNSRGEHLTWRAFVNGTLKESFMKGLDWEEDILGSINRQSND